MLNSKTAVSNTGPILHLHEIRTLKAFGFCKKILIPPAVKSELRLKPKSFYKIQQLSGKSKDFSMYLIKEYNLDIGEAEAIALAIQEEITLFFTDDMLARDAAKRFNLEPHGSIGILLRAFREGILSKEQTLSSLDLLHKESSFYITSSLIKLAKDAVRDFK